MLASTCGESKKEEKMMPVEPNNGIGDGAPSLDTLLKYQTPPIVSPKDTIPPKKTDSL